MGCFRLRLLRLLALCAQLGAFPHVKTARRAMECLQAEVCRSACVGLAPLAGAADTNTSACLHLLETRAPARSSSRISRGPRLKLSCETHVSLPMIPNAWSCCLDVLLFMQQARALACCRFASRGQTD